jgi:hypothetical protein
LPVGLVALLACLVALLARLVALLVSAVPLVTRQFQVVLEGEDLCRGGQCVALIEQFPDPGRLRELAARVPPVAAVRPLRTHHARLVQVAQESRLDAQERRRLADGERGIVVVVQLIERHVPPPACLGDADE